MGVSFGGESEVESSGVTGDVANRHRKDRLAKIGYQLELQNGFWEDAYEQKGRH